MLKQSSANWWRPANANAEGGSSLTTEPLDTRRLRVLRHDWSAEALARFFLLTTEDMLLLRTCRGAANRLGFALNLLFLRLLWYPLPELELAPARIVRFVAMQLDVHPDVLAEYGIRRPQTRDEHLVQIRHYLGLRTYSHEQDDARLSDYLLTRALQRDDPAVLLEEAEDWLREEGILFPAESAIQRIITQVGHPTSVGQKTTLNDRRSHLVHDAGQEATPGLAQFIQILLIDRPAR